MKSIIFAIVAIVGLVAGDVSHLSNGYDYHPPAPVYLPPPQHEEVAAAPPPAPAYLPPPQHEEVAAAPPPAPAYLPPPQHEEVAAAPPPAPAPEYLPPPQHEEIAAAPPPSEYLPPSNAAIEPEAAHELQDDGYHYRTIKRYRFRSRF